jgi:predicted transcriptional regulator
MMDFFKYISKHPDVTVRELIVVSKYSEKKVRQKLQELLNKRLIFSRAISNTNHYSVVDENIRMLDNIPKGKLSFAELLKDEKGLGEY